MSDTTLKTYTATTDLAAWQQTLTGPSWLSELRVAAAKRFSEMEWPTTADEEWRRTSLRAFQFDSYRAGMESSVAAATPDEGDTPGASDNAPASDTPGTARAGRIVFHDGHAVSRDIRGDLEPRGVVFGSLVDLADTGAALKPLKKALRGALENADNRLVAWNLALLADAAVLYVPRGIEVTEPFEMDFRLSGQEAVRAPHVVVILEEGARASVVKRVSTGDEGEVLVLDADLLQVGQGANLRFATVQRCNDESLVFANSRAQILADGHIHRTEAQLGGDFVKTRFVNNLQENGADAVLNGLFFATDEQHMDIRTVQAHSAPRTSSRAFYRGAVSGESHSVYQGFIAVTPDAKGTDAYLTSKNLVLSDEARADSIPSLNIATDDVKCSHGSTTGKLDESQMFYLRTRGYSAAEARRTLIEGYFEDLIAQTPEIIHDELRGLVDRRLTSSED